MVPAAAGVIREALMELGLLPGEVSEAEKAQLELPAPSRSCSPDRRSNHTSACEASTQTPRGIEMGKIRDLGVGDSELFFSGF